MWFWSSPSSSTSQPADDASKKTSSCPVMHEHDKPPSCPVAHSSDALPQSQPPPSCPAHQPSEQATASSSPSAWSKLNPLNYMFSNISQSPSPNQSAPLSVERETSSIPRPPSPDGQVSDNWEYPSPQQMYNAMLRKGYTDTPADAVESMVAVHNFLNEGAWREIMLWEHTFGKGLMEGWKKCRTGEENLTTQFERKLNGESQDGDANMEPPKLVRFMGRPQEMTPKASTLLALGWLLPSQFGTDPPFDRHDWYVSRNTPGGPREVRYVIDYYSAPPEPSGEPVFYLDIRPALDSPSAVLERLMRWGGDTWWRASGGPVRDHR